MRKQTKGKSDKSERTTIRKIEYIAKTTAYIFCAIVTIGIIGTIINSLYRKNQFDTNGKIVEGVVVSKYCRYIRKNRVYVCVYEYTYNNKEYKDLERTSKSISEKYHVGECIQVLVNKDKPTVSTVYSEHSYKCDHDANEGGYWPIRNMS